MSEPAFPTTGLRDEQGDLSGGLTKLEYFAGQAMQGLLSNDCNQSDIEAQAISHAKELFKQLNKKVKNV